MVQCEWLDDKDGYEWEEMFAAEIAYLEAYFRHHELAERLERAEREVAAESRGLQTALAEEWAVS